MKEEQAIMGIVSDLINEGYCKVSFSKFDLRSGSKLQITVDQGTKRLIENSTWDPSDVERTLQGMKNKIIPKKS